MPIITNPTGYAETTSASSSTNIWRIWVTGGGGAGNNITTMSGAGGGTSQGAIWTQWVVAATGATGATASTYASGAASNAVWAGWNQTHSTVIIQGTGAIATAGRGVTDAERRQWAEQEVQYKKRTAEQEAARVAAEEKAEKLLRSLLSPEQREDLEKKRCFYLYVGDKKYRIDRGTHGNVKRVDPVNDEVIESFCIQPSGVPVPDSMAAQKLLLETDPEKFRKIANVRRIRATG